MDECWLDVTSSRMAFGTGEVIGGEIRRRIRKELGLTISVGISFNKVFAKLGSDLKKPDATTLIPPDGFQSIVWPLPVEDLLWVGPKSASLLHRFGIDTIGQLAHANSDLMRMKFGKKGMQMKEAAAGMDASPVLPCDAEPPMKSIGHGVTLPRDLTEPEEVRLLIFALCQRIGEQLRFHEKLACGIALDCKDCSFFVKSLQKKLTLPSDCTATLAEEAFRLFRERYAFRTPLRSLSVRAIDLKKRSEGTQLSLFDTPRDRRSELLDRVGDRLREKYGKNALVSASLLHYSLPDDNVECTPFSAP